jgi:hypothetical protein
MVKRKFIRKRMAKEEFKDLIFQLSSIPISYVYKFCSVNKIRKVRGLLLSKLLDEIYTYESKNPDIIDELKMFIEDFANCRGVSFAICNYTQNEDDSELDVSSAINAFGLDSTILTERAESKNDEKVPQLYMAESHENHFELKFEIYSPKRSYFDDGTLDNYQFVTVIFPDDEDYFLLEGITSWFPTIITLINKKLSFKKCLVNSYSDDDFDSIEESLNEIGDDVKLYDQQLGVNATKTIVDKLGLKAKGKGDLNDLTSSGKDKLQEFFNKLAGLFDEYETYLGIRSKKFTFIYEFDKIKIKIILEIKKNGYLKLNCVPEKIYELITEIIQEI